jgi:hypothetical protein
MRYQAIRDHEGRFPVTLMCRALAISPSGYYAGAARPESRRMAMNRRMIGTCAAHLGFNPSSVWNAIPLRSYRAVAIHQRDEA